MTTNTNPKDVRLALNGAGIHTSHLDIQPSSHGVLITTLTETQADATLIVQVIGVLLQLPGLDNLTRRGPWAVKVNNPRPGRKGRRLN